MAPTATGASGRELRGTARAGPEVRVHMAPAVPATEVRAVHRWRVDVRPLGVAVLWAVPEPPVQVRRGPVSLAPVARVPPGREARGAGWEQVAVLAALRACDRVGRARWVAPVPAPSPVALTPPTGRHPARPSGVLLGPASRLAARAGPAGAAPAGAPAVAGEVARADGGHAAARPAAKSFRRNRRPLTPLRTRPSPRAR